jgi:hypothetical protein
MFSKYLKNVLRDRKKAIRSSIPDNFLKLLNYKINRAIFYRQIKPTGINKKHDHMERTICYLRAMDNIFTAMDILDAHLTKRFDVYKNSLLKGFLNAKKIRKL